ncbi:MAG: polysaccharide biosynthesis tyrosine autokinase [Verrucomicrobiota bacterium]
MENQPILASDTASPQHDNVNLRHYWHVILERRWLVIAAFVSVFVLSLIYLVKAPRIYQAVARIQIDREADNILNVKEALSFDGRETDYLQTQYKNLKSRTLIESIITQLHLDNDERYAKEMDKYRAVDEDIQVVPIRLSRLVDVKVEHPNAKTAAQMANTLVRTFIEDNVDLKREESIEVSRFLEAEANTFTKKVEEADKRLQSYKEEKKSVSLEERQNIDLLALQEAQTSLSKAQAESAVAQTNALEVGRLLKSGALLSSIPQVADDNVIKELQTRIALQQAELDSLLKIYKEKWPTVARAREGIASLTNSLNQRAQIIVAAINTKATFARATEASLANQVELREKKVLELSRQQIDYAIMNREAQSKRELLNKVLDRKLETEITSKSKPKNMRVVDLARDPLKPIKPRIMLTIFLGLFGGLGVAIGLAFFVNYLDDSIKSQDDVETYLRLPFLGYVPNIKTNSLVERDLQAHLHPRSTAAEGFRTIRAAISLMPRADKFRILTVTSTIPSEGKSLLASNLAIVTAQTGLKTLLVDADLRRPSVHKAFQLHSPIGLSAYLTEEISRFDECIHSTEVPNLDVVCCGSIPSSPSELIGSKRMMQFLQEVRLRYDRIVLDCPPVSAVSDPLVLAAKSDGVVFVTKFNKIRREMARRTIQRLQDAGIHILGVILNDIDFEGRDSYYYSYYYYQNRYYASHYKSDKTGSEKAPDKEKLKKS